MASAKLKLLAKAQTDLIELRRYSVKEFGKEVADRYVDDMESAFRLLCENPRIGVERPEFGLGIRVFSKRKHRIFYRIGDEAVQIVRVIHHAVNPRGRIS